MRPPGTLEADRAGGFPTKPDVAGEKGMGDGAPGYCTRVRSGREKESGHKV